MQVLDVGSGLTCSSPIHPRSSEVTHIDILRDCVGLDCQATVMQLPFKDKSFDVVYLSHVLEHLEQPLKALQEIKRVSRNLAVIRVPNELYTQIMGENSHEHIYSWTVYTLTRLLQRVFPRVHVETLHRISQRKEQDLVRRKIQTLKTYLIALFCRIRDIDNEIIGYCNVES